MELELAGVGAADKATSKSCLMDKFESPDAIVCDSCGMLLALVLVNFRVQEFSP